MYVSALDHAVRPRSLVTRSPEQIKRFLRQLDAPAVIRRNRASQVEALQQSGVDKYDIPAFLRKQAD